MSLLGSRFARVGRVKAGRIMPLERHRPYSHARRNLERPRLSSLVGRSLVSERMRLLDGGKTRLSCRLSCETVRAKLADPAILNFDHRFQV